MKPTTITELDYIAKLFGSLDMRGANYKRGRNGWIGTMDVHLDKEPYQLIGAVWFVSDGVGVLEGEIQNMELIKGDDLIELTKEQREYLTDKLIKQLYL